MGVVTLCRTAAEELAELVSVVIGETIRFCCSPADTIKSKARARRYRKYMWQWPQNKSRKFPEGEEDRVLHLHRRRTPMGEVFTSQRSLITILTLESEQNLQHVSSQQNCQLLTHLPFEIRQCIWDHYAGGKTIELRIEENRSPATGYYLCLTAWPCLLGPSPLPRIRWSSSRKKAIGSAGSNPSDRYAIRKREERELWPGWPFMDIVPLLLTCRQIYSEVLPTFLSSNIFKIESATLFMALPDCLLPQRIQTIRQLRFSWNIYDEDPPLPPYEGQRTYQRDIYTQWITIWRMLATMTGLQDLRIGLNLADKPWCDMDFKKASEIIKPIRAVTTPRYFEIRLPLRQPSAEASRAWDSLSCHIMWIIDLSDSDLEEILRNDLGPKISYRT